MRQLRTLFTCDASLPAGGSVHVHGSLLDDAAFRSDGSSDIDLIVIWPSLDRRIYRTIRRQLASMRLAGRCVHVETRVGPCLPSDGRRRPECSIPLHAQILPHAAYLSPAARLALEGVAATILGAPLPSLGHEEVRGARAAAFRRRDLTTVHDMVCARRSAYWRWSEGGRFRRLFRSVAVADPRGLEKLRRHAAAMLVGWAVIEAMRQDEAGSRVPPDLLLALASCVDERSRFEMLWTRLPSLQEETGE